MSLLHWHETVMVEQINAGQIYEVTVESASIASVVTKYVQAGFVEGRAIIARPNLWVGTTTKYATFATEMRLRLVLHCRLHADAK